MRVLMIAAALAVAASAAAAAQTTHGLPGTIEGRADVVDGDTVIVNGVNVRLQGVDAPEWHQPGGPPATDAMREIVGKWLRCQLTGQKTRGRDVGYCFNAAGKDIAAEIISGGWALSCPRYDVDQRYLKSERPEAVHRQPRASYCVSPPSVAQAPQPAPASPLARAPAPPPCHATEESYTPPSTDCAIKGNINRSGERIYHMPEQPHYPVTKISPNKGERWFRTEAEAIAAGWRKSKV
jgi:endonuclease YncB( thermonuclease family)